MPELPVGSYLPAGTRQAPEHDRVIPDYVRRQILKRDDYKCRDCGWNFEKWNPSDPGHLEAHHIDPRAKGGENSMGHLITRCNICHGEVHGKWLSNDNTSRQ